LKDKKPQRARSLKIYSIAKNAKNKAHFNIDEIFAVNGRIERLFICIPMGAKNK
jgi:hypothetical protein